MVSECFEEKFFTGQEWIARIDYNASTTFVYNVVPIQGSILSANLSGDLTAHAT
jgi:hypothetical protein